MNISLVIPTISRPTLVRCLESLRGQAWREGDEVLLIGDGRQPVAECLWRQFGLPGRYLETPKRLGFWGHGVRNWINSERIARGSHLMNLDDDDALRPGAVEAVRTRVAHDPSIPYIFQMHTVPTGKTIWIEREIKHENVGTPMIVTPNDPARLGTWQNYYGGDFAFIRETCEKYYTVSWQECVIADVWPAVRTNLPKNGIVG